MLKTLNLLIFIKEKKKSEIECLNYINKCLYVSLWKKYGARSIPIRHCVFLKNEIERAHVRTKRTVT